MGFTYQKCYPFIQFQNLIINLQISSSFISLIERSKICISFMFYFIKFASCTIFLQHIATGAWFLLIFFLFFFVQLWIQPNSITSTKPLCKGSFFICCFFQKKEGILCHVIHDGALLVCTNVLSLYILPLGDMFLCIPAICVSYLMTFVALPLLVTRASNKGYYSWLKRWERIFFFLAFVIDSGIHVILQSIDAKYIKYHAELMVS